MGNVRVSYRDGDNNGVVEVSEILEEANYYPFGMQHKGYNEAVTSTNLGQKIKYNGKELQDELQLNIYDYGARNYDPAIGRWVCTDPVIHYSTSPYSAFENNSVYWADPSGTTVKTVRGGITATGSDARKLYQALMNAMDGISTHFTTEDSPDGGQTFEMFASFDIGGGSGGSSGGVGGMEQDGTKWDSYNSNINVTSYNCAGLALRTYQYLNVEEFKYFLEKNNKGVAEAGNIMFVLWQYSLYGMDENGVQASKVFHDFHIVGGLIRENGVVPNDVYSKNGARPVFGPGDIYSWIPGSLEQARQNDGSNALVPNRYIARFNMVQNIYYVPMNLIPSQF